MKMKNAWDDSESKFQVSLQNHLEKWGLKEYSNEADYYAWQKRSLSVEQIKCLNVLSEKRKGGVDEESDLAFYDLVASSDILQILYSQQYGYYETVGKAIASQLDSQCEILDFGCGVGILTTWYASQFPYIRFTGLDRSLKSIQMASKYAQLLNLHNVTFHRCAIPEDAISSKFDAIIATHALFQSETHPGLPSWSWKTFERKYDIDLQVCAEQQTGIGPRLDWLLKKLKPNGKLLLFEKASHLGRRVLFQRALKNRSLQALQEAVFLTYSLVDEIVRDGPLYVLMQENKPNTLLDREQPVVVPEQSLYRCQGTGARYLHEKLPTKELKHKNIYEVSGGRQAQIEIGRVSQALDYGYINIPDLFSGLLVGSVKDRQVIQEIFDKIVQHVDEEESLKMLFKSIWPDVNRDQNDQLPLYENHSPVAENIWKQLPQRRIFRETTNSEIDGRVSHIELGNCEGKLSYLYWANTFDQRQIVIMDMERERLLEEYFVESSPKSIDE